MKPKTILTLLLVAVGMTVQAQETSKIIGQISHITDGAIIHLSKSMGNNESKVYSRFLTDTVKNGHFSFEFTTDSLQKLMLSAEAENFPSSFLSIWVMPTSVTQITGSNNYIRTWKIKSNVKEQQEEEIFREPCFDTSAKLDSLSIIYSTLRSKRETLNAGNERNNVINELSKINSKEDSIRLTQDSVLYRFMRQEPLSEAWIKQLSHQSMNIIFNRDYKYADVLKRLFERLSPKQKESEDGQNIRRNLFPLPVVLETQPMADGILFDPENNEKKITRYKGNYLLLDFWSTGCGPCIAAFPEMKEIHEQLKEKLTIISISVDDKETWKKAMEWHKLPWTNLNDFHGMSGYAARYGIRGIPFYVLISPDGTVEKMWSGYGKGSLKKKLKDIL